MSGNLLLRNRIAMKLGYEPEDVGVNLGTNFIVIALPVHVEKPTAEKCEELQAWLQDEGLYTGIVRFL